jgi:ribonuclease P protein subunit RPR2
MVKYRRHIRARRENRAIALERIRILFQRAQTVIHSEPELAQRYVELARKLSMRYKVKIPVEFKRRICKHCKRFILPGYTCRIRIQQKREPHVVMTCLICGEHMRIPLRKKAKNSIGVNS